MQRVRAVVVRFWMRLKQYSWKRIALIGGAGLVIALLVMQFLYPSDRLLPFVTIDGVNLGGQKKSDAIATLNDAYSKHHVSIYMGNREASVVSPTLSELDIKVDNTDRISQLDYPWYLRLVPTSLWWAAKKSTVVPDATVGDNYDDYINAHIMPECQTNPVDATLKANGARLELVPSKTGGQCEQDEVLSTIKKLKPVLTTPSSVRVAMKETAPVITDTLAQRAADELNTRIGAGISMLVGGSSISIGAQELFSWLDFSQKDGNLVAVVNGDRAGDWLQKNVASKVAVQAGVSRITTRDFTEISRVNGASGQALDTPATIATIQGVVSGTGEQATARVKAIPPSEQYTRTYSPSDTGMSALMANYAHDHSGVYGISMIELGGKGRRADYNGNKQFVTASTYKLFAAYTLLKQIDEGKRDWATNADCFNKMISLSDNACAEAFLKTLGLSTITNDIHAVGLSNSTFMKSGGPFTTANDLSLMLGMIATGQNYSTINQQRLIGAMKANVYRRGIPSGVNGAVADKVGFMDGLLHDAAIVYSPSGTYVLAIMTDGSSWANIAELARQLDALHVQ
ncbi:serine hydrolase [Candidatus Saccharimonas aalborgensis]|nr:serine hydrolase [Candidatus Saccharimonas aalborgensis]QQS68705.1 MAG: serine hydrolase [Candidatus Saccharibacteria bacterium]